LKSLMAKNQRDYIISHVKNHMLEFGSGGSSLYFAQHVPYLTSIEHSRKWYDKLKPLMPDNVDYQLHERNVEGDFSEEDTTGVMEYVYPRIHQKPDVVLVDGIARGACLATTFQYLPEAIVFLHDANRDWYEWATFFYPNQKIIEPDEGDYPPLLLKLWR